MLVSYWRAWGAGLWMFLVIGCGSGVIWLVQQQPLLKTSMLTFLPEPAYPPNATPLVRQYGEAAQRKLVYLLESDSLIKLQKAAVELEQRLPSSGVWQRGNAEYSMSPQEVWGWWQRYRGGLLSEADRDVLMAGRYDAVIQQFIARLFSPATMSAAMIEQDPLFLLQNFLLSGSSNADFQTDESGRLFMQRDGRFASLIVFDSQLDVFQLESNQLLMAAVSQTNHFLKSRFPVVEVTVAGAALYVNSGVNQARQEVMVVGLGSLVAILALFLWAFRSAVPFMLSLFVLSCGLLFGFSVTYLLLGPVHVLAFVFCSSVIGLGVDYCLHYFVQRVEFDTPREAMVQVTLPTALGMTSSVFSFCVLALLPFPGFRQTALMTAASLLAVWVSIVLWLPFLDFGAKRGTSNQVYRFASSLLAALGCWRRYLKTSAVAVLCLLGLALVFALRITPVDDLRQLQAPEASLRSAEQRIADWLGFQNDTAYFLVLGENEDILLRNTEALCTVLHQPQFESLVQARCITDWLPSPSRQRVNQILQAKLATAGDDVWQPLLDIGLEPERIAVYRKTLGEPAPVMQLEDFIAGPLGRAYRSFWLLAKDDSKSMGVVVQLSDIRDREALAELADKFPQVHWVDTVSDINGLLQAFRRDALMCLLLGYGVISLLLIARYGLARSRNLILPVAAGTLAVCAAAGLGLISFNLFASMALILIAGMGIDYGIFFMETRGRRLGTFIAVVISGMTTLIAFGLLALSSTQAIESFGLTTLVGLTTVLVCNVLLETKEIN